MQLTGIAEMADRSATIPIRYRRSKDTGTWHWSPKCSSWPTIAYFLLREVPSEDKGGLCSECELSTLTEARSDRDQIFSKD